jgi:hypothetical protein
VELNATKSQARAGGTHLDAPRICKRRSWRCFTNEKKKPRSVDFPSSTETRARQETPIKSIPVIVLDLWAS